MPNQCLHWCWNLNVSNELGKGSRTKQQTCSSSRVSEMAWWLDVLGLTILTDKLMLSRNSLRWTSNSLELCTTNIIPPTWKIKDNKITNAYIKHCLIIFQIFIIHSNNCCCALKLSRQQSVKWDQLLGNYETKMAHSVQSHNRNIHHQLVALSIWLKLQFEFLYSKKSGELLEVYNNIWKCLTENFLSIWFSHQNYHEFRLNSLHFGSSASLGFYVLNFPMKFLFH